MLSKRRPPYSRVYWNLEPYASECVLVMAGQSGIRDVFAPDVNGFEIRPGCADSIRAVLEALLRDSRRLLPIAWGNREAAARAYRTSMFRTTARHVIESGPPAVSQSSVQTAV